MFTTLTFITCLLWRDDMTFHVFELREKDLTRVKVLRIWDATYLLYLCTIGPPPAFPLTGCACRLFSSFIGVFFFPILVFAWMMDDKKTWRLFSFRLGLPSKKRPHGSGEAPIPFWSPFPSARESTMASLWAATIEHNRGPAGRFTDISVWHERRTRQRRGRSVGPPATVRMWKTTCFQ